MLYYIYIYKLFQNVINIDIQLQEVTPFANVVPENFYARMHDVFLNIKSVMDSTTAWTTQMSCKENVVSIKNFQDSIHIHTHMYI